MGTLFRCPYCGAHNMMGQRFCSHCRTPFLYTCTSCNSQVDPSHNYCPNCTASMEWAVKPKVHVFPKPAPDPMPRYKITILSLAGIMVIGLAIWSYVSYQSSFAAPLEFAGYESSGQTAQETDNIVTAPPDSQFSGNPPYRVKTGSSFNLVNNEAARSGTLKELKDFLYEDKTDEIVYVPGSRMCGYFAQTVHNNAEKAGIKAGVVIVSFQGESILHALNVFQTSDKGLVYIDCTGTRSSPGGIEEWLLKLVYPRGQDRMAYIAAGKPYGTIPLQDAESPQYSYFSGYSKNWSSDQSLGLSQPSIVKTATLYW
jgi:hypothetical protein